MAVRADVGLPGRRRRPAFCDDHARDRERVAAAPGTGALCRRDDGVSKTTPTTTAMHAIAPSARRGLPGLAAAGSRLAAVIAIGPV